MKKQLPILFVTMFLFLSQVCYGQKMEQRFKFIVDSTYQAHPNAVGIMIHVASPNKDISWTYAVGYADKVKKQKVNKDQPVLLASNTKTYMAAAILKLVENGKLQLNDPIKKHLPIKTNILLEKTGYDVNKITVRQLLSHTSGITDYVNDAYFKYVGEHPKHAWTRKEQIELAMKMAKPVEAGKTFVYGDINYLLLSEVLERETGKPFYIAISDLLDFKKLHLHSTWFINLEKKPVNTGALAHQYSDTYHWDSFDLDPSWDVYGGGGLASNTKDLALFFQYLFNGKIIKDTAVLSQMYAYTVPREASNNYCLGLYNFPSFFGNRGYYHGGWWGTDVMYLPELNTTVAVFTLEREQRDLNAEISNKIVQLIKAMR